AVQYPPREACHNCLSLRLDWRLQTGRGELISETTLAHSHDEFFRRRLPWRVGVVRLDSGPTIIAHLHSGTSQAPARVRVDARLDLSGMAVLIAVPEKDVTNMTDDPQLRHMTCDPRLRNVLVTDGSTAVGQSLVRSLVAAGAALVWVGCTGSSLSMAGVAALQQLGQVSLVPLDVANAGTVQDLATQIGAQVDILINTAELHRTGNPNSTTDVENARAEMEVNYFGLLRLAQAFGPAMRARDTEGRSPALAWVNLLSIYALANFPAQSTFSASKAAAYSLTQSLRAEMQRAGMRVINAFPGPTDDGSNPAVPQLKLAPAAVADAIVTALRDGLEDVYPGEMAQEWLARWRETPKGLEREISAGQQHT
ncbi:MAG: SDR family NAD(P)-dependent oxidoreductase, partial [Steroidobacteraceae bacterium]